MQEAATLHRSIEDAIARMAQAVRWLTQELPLNSTPVVTLVTAVGPGGAAASGDLPFPGGPATAAAAAVGGPESVAGAAPGAAERIVCAFPRFKQPLDIPIAAEDGPLLGGGDGGGGKGEEAAGGGGDKGGSGGGGGDDSAVAVNVWLHSPLGPAVAGITTTQLRRSADAGGAPVTLTATPREAEEARAQASRSKLEVQVQFTATWLPPPAAPQRRRLSSMLSPANAAGSSGSVVGGGTNNGSSGLIAMLAVLCVPLLAGWLDLPAAAAGSPAVQVLQSVAFLVSSIAAVVAIVVLQLKSWARQAPLPQASLGLEASGGTAPVCVQGAEFVCPFLSAQPASGLPGSVQVQQRPNSAVCPLSPTQTLTHSSLPACLLPPNRRQRRRRRRRPRAAGASPCCMQTWFRSRGTRGAPPLCAASSPPPPSHPHPALPPPCCRCWMPPAAAGAPWSCPTPSSSWWLPSQQS